MRDEVDELLSKSREAKDRRNLFIHGHWLIFNTERIEILNDGKMKKEMVNGPELGPVWKPTKERHTLSTLQRELAEVQTLTQHWSQITDSP